MNKRLQRIAINRAEIKKRCKLLGPICEGARAFRNGFSAERNPYLRTHHPKEYHFWLNGWYTAQDRQREKE